ncbi:hypothetical protein [Pedobacter sp. SYSU D00535]|uniref:hypothetical protein n=1 Tax=Pedobacter sp. SYSU D00535 TaxID=2810308 RepID=UPI001A972420|nr:hypothetical protein [Pedobacter sp. SYSU D00535]
MENFEIQIGQERRRLVIEPVIVQETSGYTNVFRITDPDINSSLAEKDPVDIDDIPTDSTLGQITIRTEKDFDFEGGGTLSGDELLGIAAQIVRHPTFNGADSLPGG